MEKKAQTTQIMTLHQAHQMGENRDIADNVFDWVNCFEFSEPKTSANDNNIDDNYNNVMLWIADNVQATAGDRNYINCNITEFIEENRAIFDAFLNVVYKDEYQPQNMEKIEPESEEFFDYYLEGAFAGLINGNFSDEDYTTLWRIICESRADKTTLKTQAEKMAKMSSELEALHYAKYLTSEKHKNALDMVQNVPNNIYIEDWKREEKALTKKCDFLDQLENDLQRELYKLCDTIEKERNEQRKALDNYFISNLSSAYQESAIIDAVDTFNDSGKMTAQEFAELASENYREQLRFAGFKGMTGAQSVYKGFAKYGDEIQVQAVALVAYGVITK